MAERTVLFLCRKQVKRAISVLKIEGAETVVERAQIAFDAGIVAGKAVEVGDDGSGAERGAGTAADDVVFQAIEPVEAKMLDGDAVNEEFFVRRLGVVFRMERRADILENAALARFEVRQEEFIGGAEAVL